MKVDVISSSIDAINAVLAHYHIVDDVFKGIIGVAIPAHEYIDGHVVVFRPCVYGYMGFG